MGRKSFFLPWNGTFERSQSYLKKQKATIFNLQETFSRPEDEKIWTAEWVEKVFFSPMERNIGKDSQCCVINPASKFQVSIVEIIDPLPREVLNH